MADVGQVQLHLLPGQEFVAAHHLGQAGQARHDVGPVAPAVDALLEFPAEHGALGPGADQRHIPLDDIPQLWYFIDARSAHESSERRDPTILAVGPPGAPGLGVDVHGTELVEPEYPAVLADPVLRVDHGTGALALDLQRNDEHRGRQDDGRGAAVAAPGGRLPGAAPFL